MSRLGFLGFEFEADSRVDIAKSGSLESRKAKSYIDCAQMIEATLAVIQYRQ